MEAYERALEHALRVDESPLREIIAAQLANAYIYGPLPVDEGLARLRALRLQVRGRTLAARITTLEGALLGIAGRTEEAWATYERGQAELAELGLAGVVGVTGLGPSQIASSAGDLEGSIRELAAGRVRLLAKGETSVRSTVEAWLAMWLAWLGRDDEAIEVSMASESISVPDDFATEAGWRQARALAFAHQGRLDDARRLIGEALDVWRRTDQPVAHAQGLEIAGEIERIAGVPDAARTAWAEARTLYEAQGQRPGRRVGAASGSTRCPHSPRGPRRWLASGSAAPLAIGSPGPSVPCRRRPPGRRPRRGTCASIA